MTKKNSSCSLFEIFLQEAKRIIYFVRKYQTILTVLLSTLIFSIQWIWVCSWFTPSPNGYCLQISAKGGCCISCLHGAFSYFLLFLFFYFFIFLFFYLSCFSYFPYFFYFCHFIIWSFLSFSHFFLFILLIFHLIFENLIISLRWNFS